MQKRTLKTRERLISVAREIVTESGCGALRVEQVVTRAAVAKGTFFAHFKDKDALMDILIGADIDAALDKMEPVAGCETVADLIDRLMPFLDAISKERYVFDVFLRLSGALAVEDIGPIATTLYRQDRILVEILTASSFRNDVSADLLAEGVQAFCINAIALSFCALRSNQYLRERLEMYLNAWLMPQSSS